MSKFDVGEYLNEDEVYALTEESIAEPITQSDELSSANPDFRMDKFFSEAPRSEIEAPRSLMTRDTQTARTGPKGVIADFKQAQSNATNIKMRQRIAAEREITRQVGSRTQITLVDEFDLDDKQSIKQSIKQSNNQLTALSDEEEEDSDDEAAFASFVQQRMSLMEANKQTFGSYDRIESRAQFAAELDTINQSIIQSTNSPICIVHIYDNSFDLCARLHFAFTELARQFDEVRFVRLRREDGFTQFPAAGLPALLIYRGKELIHTALRVGEALGAKPSDTDVARLLQAVGALKQRAPIAQLKSEYQRINEREQPSKQAIRTTRTSALSSDSDSD